MNPATTAPSQLPAEAQWVEAELVRSLMQSVRGTQVATLLLVPVYVGVLWEDVAGAALLVWALLAMLAMGARFWVTQHYARRAAQDSPTQQLAFFYRWSALWPAGAAVWGSTAWLFFDSAPLSSQFICWLLLAGIAMFGVNALSGHLRTVRRYINALVLTALALVAWRVVLELQFRGPYYHYWLMALLVIFWQVLHQTANRLHVTHRRNYELLYRNNQLISSLTRQTQAALEAVDVKNRFLASATHDIRQPVHALGLYADWLASEPELVHELAPKIVESTKAVNTLFDSLFDLVRLDTGNLNLAIEEVPLERLLAELEVQYRPLATSKGLQLRVRPARGTVSSDMLLLKRIVGNLLSNAIKYTEHGGVLVAVRGTGERRRIEVWDTGVGIAPAHQREVFREFYKVPMHSGTEDGFGLGLHIVSRLSQILGHPVELASRPGRGTVFRLLLTPALPAQAAARAAAMNQLARRP
ncbi:HAMP domain-containing sensor histidine kinase [Ramlibacter sp. AN1015]|uniref:sensor histidine kinase n=1 Tax=Ramlibacter sp. AN1015 TaxID=3133428 RepID=UPI0030BBB0FD